MASRKTGTTRVKVLKKPVESDLGFSWGRGNSIVLGLGILALVVGYVLLSRGDTTLAPVLLVAGYCGFIPASLLLRRRGERSGE